MAIRLSKIYTRTGDDGETSLLGGSRVPKDSARVDCYGTIDELNAAVGLARAEIATRKLADLSVPLAEYRQVRLADMVHLIQQQLFNLGAIVAAPGDADPSMLPSLGEPEVRQLETWMDGMQTTLAPLDSFVLPGGSELSARLHLARTICRRAERDALRLRRTEPVPATVPVYLNRLSDFLFVLSRWTGRETGDPELLWDR